MSFLQSLFTRSQVRATVLRAENITPRMRRLALGGVAIADWLQANAASVNKPAAWVKVTLDGRSGRGYTLRRVDTEVGVIDLDFVLHGEGEGKGTVSDWARLTRPGDAVEIQGPRNGGFQLFADSRWFWLAADATALPAVARILEVLPANIEAHVFLVIHDSAERQPLNSLARLQVEWGYSTVPQRDCIPAVRPLTQSPDLAMPGQVWIAGEADWVKSWRAFWLNERHQDRRYVNAKGYWKAGERGHRG
ncbi:MAG: siderophore-interacting protein [Zoogloeaceae bacterium]|jgi:NADPH-dependent ferric siderophore reductase|nr:siderophore-interacting protein [Zoogloeaceae bacterium]